MLSIGAMGKGQGAYYLDLAQEDYYLQGGEPLGQWWAGGADLLQLPRYVQKEHLKRLLAGFGPDEGPLIQNAGKRNHQPGWDLTFSAPKSVSVLWSQADRETRAKIQHAHHAAVEAALAYLQQEASFSRRGKEGKERDPARLIVATFEHGTSRALDPQLHTHALVLNVCARPDGTTGTLLSKPLYQYKMAAGALYRSELSYRLTHHIGLTCIAEKSWFEIASVPRSLMEEFSKRREQITELLASRNLESASAAAFAARATREVKDIIPPRSELFENWQANGRASGFSAEELLRNRPRSQTPQAAGFTKVLQDALASITREHNYFSKKDLIRAVSERAQTGELSAQAICDGVKAELANPKHIVSLGEHDGQTHYTTPEVLALEKQMLGDAYKLAERRRHGVSALTSQSVENAYTKQRSAILTELKYHIGQMDRAVNRQKTRPINRKELLKDRKKTLTREQVRAFRHLTKKGEGNVRILEGVAGTGKSFLFRAVREAYEKAGYQVLGVTVSAKAARQLQAASGVKSITIAGLEYLMQSPLRHSLSHHAKQLLKTAFGQNPMKQFRFDKNTVVIVDEASMVSTQSMAPIVRQAKKGGGLLILSGDRAQLSAIERGGAFAELAKTIGGAILQRITRQRSPKDREFVSQMADGNAEAVLKELAKRELLAVLPDREQAKQELVNSWMHNERKTRHKALILCGTNEETAELNHRCQKARLDAGELKPRSSITFRQTKFHVGDRVVFLKNNRPLQVNNGDMATVTAVNSLLRRVTVRLDDGRRVVIPLYNYRDIALGYAITTHKAQGTTVENAYILAGGSMQDHQLSYVQLSRARGTTRVFTDEKEAGPELSELARQMSKSRDKKLATPLQQVNEMTRGWA